MIKLTDRSKLILASTFVEQIKRYLEKEEFQTAKELCEKSIQKELHSIEIYLYKGICNINLGLLEEALVDLEYCISQNNVFVEAYYWKAHCLSKKKRFKESSLILSKHVLGYKSHYLYRKANCLESYNLLKRYLFKESIEAANRALNNGINEVSNQDINIKVEALLYRGIAYHNLQDSFSASVNIYNALNQNPPNHALEKCILEFSRELASISYNAGYSSVLMNRLNDAIHQFTLVSLFAKL